MPIRPACSIAAADHPPQHVAAALVRRLDAVGGEEGHGAAVVGQHPQRLGLLRACGRSGRRSSSRPPRSRRAKASVSYTLSTPSASIVVRSTPQPVSMLGLRQRLQRAVVEHVVLHEHEVPELQEAVAVAAGPAVGAGRSRTRGRGRSSSSEQGPHGPTGAGLPEVIAAQPHDPLGGHAHARATARSPPRRPAPSRRRGRRSPTAGRGRTRTRRAR